MLLSLQVKPNSKTDHTILGENGLLKVKIKAQPIDGKANLYLVKYLAGIFKVSKSKVTLLKGSNNSYKKVKIDGNEVDLKNILNNFKILNN